MGFNSGAKELRLNKARTEELRIAIHDYRIFAGQLSNCVFNVMQMTKPLPDHQVETCRQLVRDFDAAEDLLLNKLKDAELWKPRG